MTEDTMTSELTYSELFIKSARHGEGNGPDLTEEEEARLSRALTSYVSWLVWCKGAFYEDGLIYQSGSVSGLDIFCLWGPTTLEEVEVLEAEVEKAREGQKE